MANSSTRAYNGSNATSSDDVATTRNAMHNQDPSSYNLDRFLSDVDRNHPPGYGQAQSPAESKKCMREVLHDFDTRFSSDSDPPQCSNPPQFSDSSSRC